MSSNNCIVPKIRPNVWAVIDMQGKKIGEVGAMTETEARQLANHNVLVPFRLSHIEE